MKTNRVLKRTLVLAVLTVAAAPAWGAIQAGVAKADITPKENIWLAGYAARTHRSDGVRHHLFA